MNKPLHGVWEIVDKCKFCGCSDAAACQIPIVRHGDDDVRIAAPGQIAEGFLACGWLIPGVCCTAPACVEKAYIEAWPLAEEIAA